MIDTIYGHWAVNSPVNVSLETNKQLTDGVRQICEDVDLFIPANTEQLDSWEV